MGKPCSSVGSGSGQGGLCCPPPPLCGLPLRLLQIHGPRDPGPGHKGVGNRCCFGKCFGISGTLTQFPVSGQFRSGCVPNSDMTTHGSTAHSGKVQTARPTGSERGDNVPPRRHQKEQHTLPLWPRRAQRTRVQRDTRHTVTSRGSAPIKCPEEAHPETECRPGAGRGRVGGPRAAGGDC